MAFRRIADAVVAIPFGDAGQRKFRTVGSLLEADTNDPSKGLPYVLMLDKHFNPAGVETPQGQDSIGISFYHPKEPVKAASDAGVRAHMKQRHPSPVGDDDIPF